MLKKAIQILASGHALDDDLMSACMHEIMSGRATDIQIASFLTALSIKGECAAEIAAAARVMRSKAAVIPLKRFTDEPLVDIVGTGGDMSGTFNISTAAAFVACAAGLRIAKHGNRAATSNSGSADVLEALGINIMLSPEQVAVCIERIGIGFLFARTLHPAMRYAAPVRAQIPLPTIFNLLGPLTNPADADCLVLGVNRRDRTEMMATVAGLLGRTRALVVHGLDGLDELSICAPSQISTWEKGRVATIILNPSELGLDIASPGDIVGGDAVCNAKIIQAIFKGEQGPRRDIVCLNAAAALVAAGAAQTFPCALAKAFKAVDSGAALGKLQQLQKVTSEFQPPS
ncbi:MAG: anthranilate phosphoribosyltransferase [Deltaproteobacteria bacterium]|nr:anthranilate phosphoribosyltransferase [Deltaproteobacteria bacterium]